ncbi:hypothetical protein SHI21_07745 [Bacteriovorax sp. PP10]|uniref:Uncharacterized protein n=1 Tax=Bacteriovorax antarcticus TaxID=3088717 RepID=A0ABU5VSR5_9BACT|nr:hypothetical protein [Bacteriovorax sp. PP10]MEA9356088.1 hypothetical protein [Bacteriovorax sp. PP10]
MKSLKIVLAIALVSSMIGGSAFAQSRMRGDEIIKSPQEYRLGDSDDLQGDQMKIEAVSEQRPESTSKVNQFQNHIQHKHLLKNSDYI